MTQTLVEPRSFFGPSGPMPATAGGKTLDAHSRLILDEASPRLQYIEDFYRERLRLKEETFGSVKGKIKQIKSLSDEERQHIIQHLRGGAVGTQMEHMMFVLRKRKAEKRTHAREARQERERRIYGQTL